MTTYLKTLADLIDLVGQQVGTTDRMRVAGEQMNLLADATDDHEWIHTDPKRAANGPFKGTVALDGEKFPACVASVIVLYQ
jgi:acyl dehydratase